MGRGGGRVMEQEEAWKARAENRAREVQQRRSRRRRLCVGKDLTAW